SLHIGIWTLMILLGLFWAMRYKLRTFHYWRFTGCLWLGFGLAALGTALWIQGRKSGNESVYTSRNFYGVLTVYEYEKDAPGSHHFLLQHGRITHGLQFVDAEEAKKPTTYYNEESGIGLAVSALRPGQRRIGLVGLGTGTMMAYGRAGDHMRVYEINPEVKRLASSRFAFLTNCPATVEIVMGDARLS